MYKLSLLLVTVLLVISCGKKENADVDFSKPATEDATTASDASTYDPKRGEGKYTAESLALSNTLDEAKAKLGEDASNVKCTSCHKMTDEKLVGPGWKGVTTRRTAHWIMNFITNPDPMIDKDPALQAQLELCLVRMPNQNLNDEDARKVVEFMRQNDSQ